MICIFGHPEWAARNQKPINRLLKKMIEKPEEEDEEERQPIHSN